MNQRSRDSHSGPEREIFVSPWPASFLEERRRDWLGFILPSMFAGSVLAGAIMVLAFAILISIPAAGVIVAIGVVAAMRHAAQRRLSLATARKPARRG